MSNRKRRCAACGTPLNSYNPDAVCGPCRHDDTPEHIARVQTGASEQEERLRLHKRAQANRRAARHYARRKPK